MGAPRPLDRETEPFLDASPAAGTAAALQEPTSKSGVPREEKNKAIEITVQAGKVSKGTGFPGFV